MSDPVVEPKHDPIAVLVNELDRRDERIKRQNKWIAALFVVCLASSGGTASLVITGHNQTRQELTQQANAPKEIAAIEAAVDCPVLQAENSFHSTPLRVALIAQYCTPSKKKEKP